MSNQTKTYRYPGTRPFTKDDASLFFGRDEDINNLSQFISLEKQVVLYGKSGLGKTSLLNAGIIPKLENDNYFISNVRFGAYASEKEYSPTDIIRQVLTIKTSYDNYLWNNLLQSSPEDVKTPTKQEINILENLWYYCKSIQIEQPEQQAFLILFDQFEELFTYPEEQIVEFKKSFSELLNIKVPQYIRNLIKEKGKDFLSKEEMQLLYKNLNIKVVFSIRSDKVSLLNKLKDYFPEILQKTFELEPLTINQSKNAIINPSQLANKDFVSSSYTYSENVLNSILAFLSKQNNQKIEAFQLQIVCQFIENLVIDKQITVIQPEHIGDIETVYKDFYDNLIIKLPEKEQNNARIFIEEGLIFEEDERRLALYEGQIIKNYGISKNLLQNLVDTHLIRSEPNPSGGFIYELSHDTLVNPILKSKHNRVNESRKARALIVDTNIKQIKGIFKLIFLGNILVFVFLLLLFIFGGFTTEELKELLLFYIPAVSVIIVIAIQLILPEKKKITNSEPKKISKFYINISRLIINCSFIIPILLIIGTAFNLTRFSTVLTTISISLTIFSIFIGRLLVDMINLMKDNELN